MIIRDFDMKKGGERREKGDLYINKYIVRYILYILVFLVLGVGWWFVC